MRRENLLHLIAEVRQLVPEQRLVIVGSQSFHALPAFLPDIVRKSEECDFLLVGSDASTQAREQVNRTLGIMSEFQQEQGYWADAIGLATVVLPTGWDERLQPLRDETGATVALCIEIHDTAFSKFVAGRDKDLVFLRDAFWGEYLNLETFVARLRLLPDMPQAGAFRPRLERLIKFLKPYYELRHVTDALQRLAREIGAPNF